MLVYNGTSGVNHYIADWWYYYNICNRDFMAIYRILKHNPRKANLSPLAWRESRPLACATILVSRECDICPYCPWGRIDLYVSCWNRGSLAYNVQHLPCYNEIVRGGDAGLSSSYGHYFCILFTLLINKITGMADINFMSVAVLLIKFQSK